MHRGRPPNSLQSSSASSRPAATTRSPAATCTPNTTTSTSWWAASTRYASATSTRSGFDADQTRVRSRERGLPRPMSAIDDYLDGLAPDQKAALARVREIVAALVPDAEEGRSYGMP